MNLLIRDVDILAVKKINQAAKKHKLSRNEYVKQHLEKLAHYDVFIQERNRFEQLWQNNQQVIQQCFAEQKIIYEQLQRLETMMLFYLDVDSQEVEELFQEFQ